MTIKLSTFVTSLFLLWAAPSIATELSDTDSSNSKSYYWFQPCNSWRMNQNGMGYVCNFPDTTIRVPDLEEVDTLKQRLSELEAQVAALTTRVAALEAGGSVELNTSKN